MRSEACDLPVPVPGMIVRSKAGRDCGKLFAIVGVLDPPFVYVADGDIRKIDKPKRKNLKHVELTGTMSALLVKKLEDKIRITNADIRKAIVLYQGDTEGRL